MNNDKPHVCPHCGNRYRITKEQEEKVVKKYQEVLKMRTVAEEFSISLATVSHILNEYGVITTGEHKGSIKTWNVRRKKLTDEQTNGKLSQEASM